MLLIDWFKKLKWIRAIRKYDETLENYNILLSGYCHIVNENKLLKEQNDQMRVVFQTHRAAAQQSIHEASEAKKKYEGKLLNG